MFCALCSRPMRSAAVYFAGMPIGPTCGRKAGLIAIAARGHNRLLKLALSPAARRRESEAQMEMDLEVGNADQA